MRSPRARTGDSGFDRKMGVYGRAPLGDRHLRRKILRLADGTFTLWTGSGARFVASAPAGSQANRHALAAGAAGTRVLVDLVDTLGDLIRASEAAAPPDTAG